MNIAFLSSLLQFIIGLGLLIIVHELGHFIAARLMNIEVEEFGIGFPPRLVKLFDFAGTEFTLNWIPLGGFVRPKGENDPEVAGGLAAAPPLPRLIVLFAGPLMNLVAAVILGTMLFYSIGEPVLNVVSIQGVVAESPAAEAGLLPGDIVVSVNGQAIDSTEKLQTIVKQNLGKEITFEYQREGQNEVIQITPRTKAPENQGAMGVILTHPYQPTTILKAIGSGTEAVYENARAILALPIRLMRGQASPEEGRLVGYKGLFDIYQQVTIPYGFFMAISVSLGIINLFPIPALDGGRILFTIPELILRRRVPARFENALHLIGFALLLILIIYINLQDFINPIQIPK